MSFITGLLLIFWFFIIYVTKKDVTSPIALFLLWWGVVCCGSALGSFYGVDPLSFAVLFIILLGILSFAIGYSFNRRFMIHNRILAFQYDNKDTDINLKNVAVICIIAMPFIVAILIAAVKMLQSGYSLLNVRAAYYGLEGYNKYWSTSTMFNFAQKYIVGPVTIAIVPVTIAYTLRRKVNIILIATCAFIVVSNILSSGGRFVLLYVIVESLAGLLLVKKQFVIKRKTKILIVLGAVVAVYGILKLTSDRNIDSSMGQKIYEYFFCCTSLFDYYKTKITNFTYGTASLNGFIGPVKSFTDYIFPIITPYEAAISGTLNIQNAVQLSSSITTNAFVTCFFYSYLDGGLFGVVIEMFLYGHVCRNSYDNEIRYNTDRSLALYLLIVQGLIKTIQLMPFCNSDYVLAIVYIILMTKNKQNKSAID